MKTIAKIGGIKGYKSMSEEGLLSVLNESEPVKKSEKNFDDARIQKIKKINKLRGRLSKPKKKNKLENIFIEKKTKKPFFTKNRKDWKKSF